MVKPYALLKRALVIAGIYLLALYGSAPLILPQPDPASAPSVHFSSARAMSHVQMLAQAPRVVGSPGMKRTADYLVETLRSYGLDPEIQETASENGPLRNVVARVKGRDPSRALLILTHPDSVSTGAGDNASGVGVLLEVARALQADTQPENDVILLFDDGEEKGYWGGYAFAKSHPWMGNVQLVMGLDTAAWGPVVLLQTTPVNAAILCYYASSVPNPTAFGFFASADWYLSHDTSEIQPFYEQGIPGLAMEDPTAFSGKHSANDTMEHIQPGSLQQMGEQTLALARSFGSVYPAQTSAGDLSFFTLWQIGVIHYPASWNFFFVGLAAAGLALQISLKTKRKAVTRRPLALAAAFILLAVLLAGLAGLLGHVIFKTLLPNPNPDIGSYLTPASLPFFLMELGALILVYLTFRAKLSKAWDPAAVSIGGLLVWLVFAAILLAILPVGSYIITIPFLIAVLVRFLPERWWLTKLLPAAVATVLIIPNIVLAYLGTGMQTLILVNILVILVVELWAAQQMGAAHQT
jgi:hypothetical protein